MPERCLFLMLDVDNTLYEYEETGFGKEMHDLIYDYAERKLNLSREEAAALSKKYYHNYGLSLRGYVEHYGVDAKDYSDYVHRCSYEKLTYDAPLVDMLTRLHLGKKQDEKTSGSECGNVEFGNTSVRHHLYYFTNANRPHARQVLEPLGLKPLLTRSRQPGSPATDAHRYNDAEGFEEQLEWLGFSYEDQWRLTGEAKANKPMKAAYEAVFSAIDEEITRDEQLQVVSAAAMEADGAPAAPGLTITKHKRAHLHPSNMVMVDDSLMNLTAPLELGWSVVWYAHDNQQLPAPMVNDGGTDGSVTNQMDAGMLYAEAVAAGRMKIIRNILELETAVEELAWQSCKAE